MHKSFSSIILSKPAVVIDLDDTLVHVTPLPPKYLDNNNYFTIFLKRRKLYVQTRPYLHYFLDHLSKLYDIFFFTASNREYADAIIDKIMPNVDKSRRFYNNSCINTYGYCVKDLNIIRRPLSQLLLIDDSAGSALNNPKNLVKIKPWIGEKNDSILKDLLYLLEKIVYERDLRISYIENIKNGKYEGFSTF